MSYVVDVLPGKQDIEVGRNQYSDLDLLFILWLGRQRMDAVHAGVSCSATRRLQRAAN